MEVHQGVSRLHRGEGSQGPPLPAHLPRGLTLRPRIWLMAALSLSVHSAMTFALISFMYSMKALRGFLMVGFLASFSALDSACVFLKDT